MADATGHGVSAALIASMVKIAFSSHTEYASNPERLLSEMNEALRDNIRGQFVTAAYVQVNPAEGIVRAAGAGNPSPLLRQADGTVVELARPGFPMGLFRGSEYDRVEAPLAAGDRILLYTDGLVELMNPEEEEFGMEQLKGFMQDQAPLPAGLFADALLEHLHAWAERPSTQSFDDDLTLIVVDILPRNGDRATG